MTSLRFISCVILSAGLSFASAQAQSRMRLADNSALRYWAAFAQMQDSPLTEEEAKELKSILEGSTPYNDAKYRGLVEKNASPLATMSRGATLSNCDWGIDYQLGSETPVEYVRKGLTLGRLNVLNSYHLLSVGDKDGAVRALVAGLHFSHDIANGGSLFATVVSKNLLISHLRAVSFAMQQGQLSEVQRALLQKAIDQLGSAGLDWHSAMRTELELPRVLSVPAMNALAKILPAYLNLLNDPSTLPEVQRMIAAAPQPIPNIIPSPKRVLEEKNELSTRLTETRALFQ